MKHYLPSDAAITYMGRIDRSEPDAPAFYWAYSLFQFRFTGSAVRIMIRNHSYDAGNGNGLRLGAELDGKESVLTLSPENGTEQTLTVTAEGTGTHSLRVWKREDGTHHFELCGIAVSEGETLSPLPLPALKLEAFGDSVTAGSWVELCSRVGQLDEPDYTAKHDNARYSFAVLTADLLHAQIHLTAQGGLALLDGSGYYENGDVGMETAYDKLRYQPAAGRLTPWDFSRYIPDYVICAIGQNDHRVGGVENVMPDTDAQERWIGTYCRLLTDLMRKYPQAHFILTLTVLMHEEIWEKMADTVCARMAGWRVHRLRFARSGRATPGHPRIPEQCEMAYELTRFIQTLIPSS